MRPEVLFHSNDSGVIIIIYPGYEGSAGGYRGKYQKIAKMLNERRIGAVLRIDNYPNKEVDYEKWVKQHLRNAIEYAMLHSEAICRSNKPAIYIMGVSAGASAAAAVAHEYWKRRYGSVEKILLIAPSTNAGLDDIKNGLANYLGEVCVAIGADDEVVSVDTARQISEFAVNASVTKFVIVPNCDHQFRGEANGKIFSKTPLWAFAGDDTFPLPEDGLKLYD